MEDKINILYVDDEVLNVEVFELTFSWNYNVFKAYNGNEGLEVLQNNPEIQFVISDMKMPGMTGLEFIQEVKKGYPALPCMILSGYQQSDEIVEALKNDVIISYMMKPFNRKKIEELINKNNN